MAHAEVVPPVIPPVTSPVVPQERTEAGEREMIAVPVAR
jgi:hypothetical protein